MGLLIVYIAGGLFDVLGLGLAVFGLSRTWKTHLPGEAMLRAFMQPVRQYVATRTNRLRHLVAKLLHIRRDATIHATTGTAHGTSTAHGHFYGYAPFPTLPDPATDLARFGDEVDDRLNTLHAEVESVKASIDTETRDRTKAVAGVRRDLDENIAETARLKKELATEGLVLQMWGLVFLFIGVALGAGGNVAAQFTELQSERRPHPAATHARPAGPTDTPTAQRPFGHAGTPTDTPESATTKPAEDRGPTGASTP